MTGQGLAEAIPQPRGRILLLVHGLCMSDLQWKRKGHDHGAALAADPEIASPFTCLYLHYNTGLHISINGREFADIVGTLVEAWPVPVEEIAIVAHSMGGLVTRSALHCATQAGHDWPRRVAKVVFLGTPHDGAPLERGGNWVNVILDGSPYTMALARLAKVRSAGITDLRHGSLADEDWAGKDRFEPSHRKTSKRLAVPLPDGVKCFAIAATVAKHAGIVGGRLVGDGLVPVHSALGHGKPPAAALGFPLRQQWIGYGMNHLDLLDRHDVYGRIRRWLA
jgi:pimeloyl-ACP methyl ester carboxylesterase